MKHLTFLVIVLGCASLAFAGDGGDAVKAADRPEADTARDAGRKPADVVDFLGIRPGMQGIDLVAAGGYYTEVLAHAVGPKGKVYAQNPPAVLRLWEGANDKALTSRLAAQRLPNVVRLDIPIQSVEVPAGSLDFGFTALNFHDIYNGSGEDQAVGFLRLVYGLLKPGGTLGLIDHSGQSGADNSALHRLNEEKARAAIAQSGFVIADSSNLLRNPADDCSKGVFALRGATDRYLLKLVKPR